MTFQLEYQCSISVSVTGIYVSRYNKEISHFIPALNKMVFLSTLRTNFIYDLVAIMDTSVKTYAKQAVR